MTPTQKPKQKSRKNKRRFSSNDLNAKRQPFSEHLRELRARTLSYFGFLLFGTLAGYLIHDQIFTLLVKPLNQPVFYTSPAGGFDFVVKISLFFGFVISTPVFVYHLLRFVEPAFPLKRPKLLGLSLLVSCALLIIGMCFAYFVSLPAALYFLNSFGTGEIQALISTNEYFTFVTRYLLGFGLLCQLPLIMWLVNSVQRIPTKALMKYQRWVLIVSFVVAAVLTPTPDVFNQLLMAVPLIALYQLSLILLWVVNRKTSLLTH